MGFSTNIFLFVFLPLFLLIYGISDSRYRAYLLLIFSVIFYMWSTPKNIIIIMVAVVMNYFLGRLIASIETKIKKYVLGAAVILNLSALMYYKYTNFAIETTNRILKSDIAVRDIIVPIGISYFTFSAISYLVDIYREKVLAEKNFVKFALYMLMFQKITAGPIVRYTDIANQLNCQDVTVHKSVDGAKRFCVGLAKKVLIADQLGRIADEIFSLDPTSSLVSVCWLGMICYTLQIYHDFSGYSDMAIGLGKICGFEFPENFNYPYISKSMTEFWRRWHISLSSWFRDYLYIPLGGNRTGNVYINLSIVFLATGLWHGSNWHFVIWGIWNGVFMVMERILKKHLKLKVPSFIKIPYTLMAVSMGWVLFRCESVSKGVRYLARLFGIGAGNAGFTLSWYLSPKIIGILLLGALACIPWKEFSCDKMCLKNKRGFGCVYIILLIVSIAVVMSSTYNSFIYFKF